MLDFIHRIHASKQRCLTKFMMMGYFSVLMLRNSPSSWSFARDDYWFSNMWTNRFMEDYHGQVWKSDFRMKGETFTKLVELLAPFL